MFKSGWKNRRRVTVEKRCFECIGVGLERVDKDYLTDTAYIRAQRALANDIVKNKSNPLVYVSRVCKVCQGNGVYEVIE